MKKFVVGFNVWHYGKIDSILADIRFQQKSENLQALNNKNYIFRWITINEVQRNKNIKIDKANLTIANAVNVKFNTLGGSKVSISASEALGKRSLMVRRSFFRSAPESRCCDFTSTVFLNISSFCRVADMIFQFRARDFWRV